MNNLTECPQCGEIELHVADNGDAECLACGHYEQHVPKYPGVDEFIKEFGYDNLDNLGLTDVVRAAFTAGRAYEMKSFVNPYKVPDSPSFKRQAE